MSYFYKGKEAIHWLGGDQIQNSHLNMEERAVNIGYPGFYSCTEGRKNSRETHVSWMARACGYNVTSATNSNVLVPTLTFSLNSVTL